MRLNGQIAFVTGAGSGLGRGVALRFAAEGATVVATDLDLVAAQDTLDAIAKDDHGTGHIALELDVASAEAVQEAVATATATAGAPSIVVNCAGVNIKVPFLEMTGQDWDTVVDINLKGTFLVGRYCAERMAEGGSIINISSVNSEVTTGEIVHYAASKGGVRSLTKAMAVALAPHQIRVNAIAPGPCATSLTAKTRETADGTARLLRGIALNRLGTPEDIAGAALFLASEDAAFITGTTLYVEGGLLSVR